MKKVLRVVLALLISFCIGVAFATEECLHQNTKEVYFKRDTWVKSIDVCFFKE